MNLIQAFRCYPDQDVVHRAPCLERVRWAGAPRCPYCDSHDVARKADGDRVGWWNCHDCHDSFNVLAGTIFSKIGWGQCRAKTLRFEGVPRTVEGAQDLWERDKYHFQKWAVESVDGFVTTKRSADGGVDGRVYFALPHAQDLQSLVIEVKGGAHVSIRDLRALRGVLDYDTAQLAGLIIMRSLRQTQARNFQRYMLEAGTLDVMGMEYPRMQLLTVADR